MLAILFLLDIFLFKITHVDSVMVPFSPSLFLFVLVLHYKFFFFGNIFFSLALNLIIFTTYTTPKHAHKLAY